jgi:hypothetical protein
MNACKLYKIQKLTIELVYLSKLSNLLHMNYAIIMACKLIKLN